MTKKLSKPKWYYVLLSVLVVSICAMGMYGYNATKGDTMYISGTIVERDLDDLLEKSCLVVEGTVVGHSDSFQIKSITGAVANYTDYYLETSTILRGETEDKEVTIRVQGGTVDKYTEIYENSPALKVGDTYLVFLYEPGRGGSFNTAGEYYYILGLTQGVFTKNGNSYTPQNGLTVSTEELQIKVTAKSDNPVDEYYFRNEYIENQKRNLETGFITQEEYDSLMKNIDVYATIIE